MNIKDTVLSAKDKTYSNGDVCELFNHEYMTGGLYVTKSHWSMR